MEAKPLPAAALAAAEKKKKDADMTPEEKKAMKEQRRLKQEADRLAKNKTTVNAPSQKRAQSNANVGEDATKTGPTIGAATTRPAPEKHQQLKTSGVAQKKQVAALRSEAQKKVPLFLHLKQYERDSGSLSRKVGFSENAWVHPSVLTLGLRYAELIIRGADARMVAMYQAFVDVIRDFTVPANNSDNFQRALIKQLNLLFDFLTRCRTHSISMGNAFNFLKAAINNSPKVTVAAPVQAASTAGGTTPSPSSSAQEEEERVAKRFIFQQMESYVRTNVFAAGEQIAFAGSKLIAEGDVILVFAWSSVVERMLLYSHEIGKKFTVLVVGARPHNEGLELLDRLVQAGLNCRYGNLPAISYMLQGVDKVFLGASALLSNGAVLSRAGTAMVAMMAKAQRKSVYVFAGSHKFSERVLLDSIVYNELGDPEELLVDNTTTSSSSSSVDGSRHILADWRDSPKLKLLNLQYDVTASQFVDMVVTEVGNLPPTSVSVILRERNDKYQQQNQL